MTPNQSGYALMNLSRAKHLVGPMGTIGMCLGLFFITPQRLGKAGEIDVHCRGLHAGTRAQIIPPFTETPSVLISFVLLNDAETPTNSSAGSWKLVIDGTELSDSGWIFGNGPSPVGGWGNLNPGETYEFAKALPINKYFPEEREYKVYWKGKDFQSSTITVKITRNDK